ncbi:MAG: hypothetical protein EXQ81_07505 [Thermoleophilia bacterium]|nr:hypothetical protein [Thermoleophilia bacterium]
MSDGPDLESHPDLGLLLGGDPLLHIDLDPLLDPDPTPAERDAVRAALAALRAAGVIGERPVSAWREAGLQESVAREPQDVSPRSSRGTERA